MDDRDIYKPMLAFAQAYNDALAHLNQKTLNFFESDAMRNAMRSMASTIKAAVPNAIVSPAIQESMKSILRSYTDLLGSYDFGYTVGESLSSVLADLQIKSLLQISQSVQTVMVHDLAVCFANAQYGGLIDILNQTMSSAIITAPDIAFIKTSELVSSLSPELVFPRGLSKSLNTLSKVTANDIADNEKLTYSTERNRFLSTDGEVDSVGLNVVCSGKQVFNETTNELFSDVELINFCSFLSGTPMLALYSETGKKIYRLLQELYESGTQSIGFDRNIYYHCRSHKKDVHPFTYDQMLRAPYGLPWAGRFNQVGRSNYYFADSRRGAESEIKKHKTNDDILQTVKIKPVKEIKLLDLSGTLARGKTFLRYLRFSLSDVNDKMPREYLIPCFVSDCCKLLGFEGIKYYGSKEYNNYVVWNDGYFDFIGMCE